MAQNFLADVRIGKKAEVTFFNQLTAIGSEPVVFNANLKYFDMLDKNGIAYEVKNDSWIKETKNLCVELWSHKPLKHPGWIYYTLADYLVYFMSDTEYLMIPMSSIKDYIKDKNNLKGKRKVNGWSKGNKDVENVLIPYTEFTNEILEVKK